MVGVNALTRNMIMTGVRRSPFELVLLRIRDLAERTRTEELARVTWMDGARGRSARPDPDARYVGLTPVRWGRLA